MEPVVVPQVSYVESGRCVLLLQFSLCKHDMQFHCTTKSSKRVSIVIMLAVHYFRSGLGMVHP